MTYLYITGSRWRVVETRDPYQTSDSYLRPSAIRHLPIHLQCWLLQYKKWTAFQLVQSSKTLCPNLMFTIIRQFVWGAGFQVHAMCKQRANCIHIVNGTLPKPTWWETSTYPSPEREGYTSDAFECTSQNYKYAQGKAISKTQFLQHTK